MTKFLSRNIAANTKVLMSAALCASAISFGTPALSAVIVSSGGMFGTQLPSNGAYDIDGDSVSDIKFNTLRPPGQGFGYIDASTPYGIVGNIGDSPGFGAAWVRNTSTASAADGVGRDEIIADFRGALLNSDDNWSKVHFSSGDGWVQWRFIGSNQATALLFVREAAGEDLTAAQAYAIANPAHGVPEPGSAMLAVLAMLAAGIAGRRTVRRA